MLILLDVWAALTGLTGLWLIGNKRRAGFLWGVVSDVLWIIVGIGKGLPGLVACCIALIVINGFGYWKWGNR